MVSSFVREKRSCVFFECALRARALSRKRRRRRGGGEARACFAMESEASPAKLELSACGIHGMTVRPARSPRKKAEPQPTQLQRALQYVFFWNGANQYEE